MTLILKCKATNWGLLMFLTQGKIQSSSEKAPFAVRCVTVCFRDATRPEPTQQRVCASPSTCVLLGRSSLTELQLRGAVRLT